MPVSDHSLSPAPAARIDGLVITETRDEMLVYDMRHHHIHHLNPVSREIWRLCDGTRTVAEIARQANVAGVVDDAAVRLALTKLAAADLLEGELDRSLKGGRQSRRAFARRAAVAGAVAVPVIVSITAPSAAAASSGSCPTQCGSGQPQCCQNSDDCKDMLGGHRGDWNCTGGGQVPGVPKGCCVRVS